MEQNVSLIFDIEVKLLIIFISMCLTGYSEFKTFKQIFLIYMPLFIGLVDFMP